VLSGASTHQFTGLEAQQPFARRVDRLDDPLQVEHEDGVRRVVHDHPTHLVDLVELLVGFDDGALGGLLCAQVPHDADVVLLACVLHAADGQVQREGLAVGALPLRASAQARHAHRLAFEEGLHPVSPLRLAGAGQKQAQVLSDQAGFAVSEDAADRLVGTLDGARRAHGQDAVDGVVDHRSQPGLAVSGRVAEFIGHRGRASMSRGNRSEHAEQGRAAQQAAQQQSKRQRLGERRSGRARVGQRPVSAAHGQAVAPLVDRIAAGWRLIALCERGTCAVEQLRLIGGQRVIDAQVQVRPVLADLRHQVGDAHHTADHADKGFAALRLGAGGCAVAIKRQPNQHRQGVRSTLDQANGLGHLWAPAVSSLLQNAAAHRLDRHVIAEGCAVGRHGQVVSHWHIGLALTLRDDAVVGVALAHSSEESPELCSTHQGGMLNGHQGGVLLLHLQGLVVGLEGGLVHPAVDPEHGLKAHQHVHVVVYHLQ